jgi:hypothetical protein
LQNKRRKKSAQLAPLFMRSVRYNLMSKMKLTYLYTFLAITFTLMFFASIPVNGCSILVCNDFQTFGIASVVLFIMAIIFSMLVLLRLLKLVKLSQINDYSPKDSHDGNG